MPIVTCRGETFMHWNSKVSAVAAVSWDGSWAGCDEPMLKRNSLRLTSWVCLALFAIGISCAPPAAAQEVKAVENTASPNVPVVVSDEARAIHSRSFIFDGHNDLPWEVRERGSRSFDTIDISKPQPQLHTDIARLHQGCVGAQYWSVYVPARTAASWLAHLTTLREI